MFSRDHGSWMVLLLSRAALFFHDIEFPPSLLPSFHPSLLPSLPPSLPPLLPSSPSLPPSLLLPSLSPPFPPSLLSSSPSLLSFPPSLPLPLASLLISFLPFRNQRRSPCFRKLWRNMSTASGRPCQEKVQLKMFRSVWSTHKFWKWKIITRRKMVCNSPWAWKHGEQVVLSIWQCFVFFIMSNVVDQTRRTIHRAMFSMSSQKCPEVVQTSMSLLAHKVT